MWNNNGVMKVRQTLATSTLASVLVASVCLTFIFSSPSAHAAGPGRIFGQLLDGTNKNAPVAGQSIT